MRKKTNVTTAELIEKTCDQIKDILLTKNRKYGDSALNPISVFYRGSDLDGLRVRIDDKLSRIANQQSDEDEDAEIDLIGYLILYKIAKIRQNEN